MDGQVVIGTKLDTKGFDLEIKATEQKLDGLIEEYKVLQKMKPYEGQEKDLREYQEQIEKTRNKLVTLKQKQDDLNKNSLSDIQNQLKSIGNGVQGVTKKMIKWSLAVFGIRTAFNFIKSSINTIAQNDDQLSADIDYMKNALAYTLEPVIRRIVELARQLMFYIAYIVKAWTGKNIFENANKSLKKSVGNVKKLNKELNRTSASFDEMNVLQSPSSGGGGADTSGAVMPSFDLTNFEDMPVPSWLDFIVKHKDEILAVLSGIAVGLIAIKLGLSPLMALGIGVAVAGIVYAIEGLLKYLKDPSWSNFGQIIQGIGIAIIGIGIAIGSVPAIVVGAVVLIVGTIIKYWDKIKVTLQNGIDWLVGKTDWVRQQFGIVGELIYTVFITVLQNLLNFFDTVFTSIKGIFDGIITFIKGVFSGNWSQAWEGIKQIFLNVLNLMLAPAKLLIGTLVDVAKNVGEKIVNVFKGVWNGITSIFSKLGTFFYDAFKSAWNKIKKLFSAGGQIFDGIKDGIVNAFKSIVNALIKGINKIISAPFDKVNGLLNKIRSISILGAKPFESLWSKNPIPVPKIPTLAKGGIVNLPGKGVPVGGALTGEVSREGVIPLTDSQQMNLLGEAIGKYIKINLTNITELDGRTIARKVQEVNSNTNFLMNR